MQHTSILTPPPAILSSWKEIANYLGRGVRTVQRWEVNYGLPVHRPKATLKGSVYALRDELDTWLHKAPYRDTQDPEFLADQLRRMEAECERMRRKLNELRFPAN